MLFTSFPFIIFFLVFYISLLFTKSINTKIISLILFSIFFLSYNGLVSVLSILFIMSGIIFLSYTSNKYFILLSTLLVISNLIFFKYFKDLYEIFANDNLILSKIIIPLGISFYSFQAVMFIYDYGKKNLYENKINFLFYISFFPQLIAGPLCDFNYIRNQLRKLKKFKFNNLIIGSYLILFGIIKKSAADYIGQNIFDLRNTYNEGYDLYLVIFIMFYFQLFLDFSGYMNIARGLAKYFNINLPLNFKSPYLSYTPSDFFERWHITLSNFIKLRIFLPLTKIFINNGLNINFSIFLSGFLSILIFGLWHGLNISFIFYALVLISIFIIWSILKIDKKMNKFLSYLVLHVLIIFAFGFVYLGITHEQEFIGNKIFNIRELDKSIIHISSFIILFTYLYQYVDKYISGSIKFRKIIVNSLLKFKIKIIYIINLKLIFILYLFIKYQLIFNFESNLANEFIYFNF